MFSALPIGDVRMARARARHKAFFLVAASVLILLAHGVDVFQAGGAHHAALVLRCAWALLLLVCAAALLGGHWTAIQLSASAASLGTAILYLSLVEVTGGSRSPLFAFAFPLAIILSVIASELQWMGLLSAAVLLAGAFALMVRDGVPAADQLGWGHSGLLALLVGWLLGRADLRALRATEQLRQARERDQARLAEAERLAAVGRLAAEVAHDVNNPLAAAKASARHLSAQLREPDEDTRSASEDLKGSLERIAELVRQLRQAARPAPPPDREQ